MRLIRGDEPLPAFCVVTAAGPRLGVLVHGAVEVTVVSGDTHAVIPRQDTATWTTRFVSGGSSVAAYLAGASPEPVGELVDLRRGVVPGDGVLLLGDAVVAAAAPEVVDELPAEPPPLPPPVSVPQVIDHDHDHDHDHRPEDEPLPPP